MLSSATKAAANVTKSLAENDLRNAARGVAHDIESNGHDVFDTVSDYALDAGQKVRGFVDQTVDQASGLSRTIQDEIKTNPIRSSAIALAAGFVIGALLARR